MECWLGHPALTQPKVTIAGKQTVAKDWFGIELESLVLLELLLLRDQNLFDEYRIRDEGE
jgi:hypothetical protein